MELAGIFTPNMVPLTRAGEIDESELRRYVDWLIARGIHGIYPNGSTGEFTRFTPEERRRIVQIVCDEVRGRIPVLAGAAEANVRETIIACERYLEYGARAVAIVSPFYYKLSAGAVYEYFREIAINSPIDVTLYNIPLFASSIDVLTVQRLAELPRVVGIKDSSGDVSHMLRMMHAVESSRPEFAFFTGWDAALVPMLAMGCHGATLASSGIVPEVTGRVYELAAAHDFQAARQLQMKLTQLFDRFMSDGDFPEGVRRALGARGFDFGPTRQPQPSSPIREDATLREQIESLISEAACA
jgi:4-hydroxy-tetrahydrodipicolinate synthase